MRVCTGFVDAYVWGDALSNWCLDCTLSVVICLPYYVMVDSCVVALVCSVMADSPMSIHGSTYLVPISPEEQATSFGSKACLVTSVCITNVLWNKHLPAWEALLNAFTYTKSNLILLVFTCTRLEVPGSVGYIVSSQEVSVFRLQTCNALTCAVPCSTPNVSNRNLCHWNVKIYFTIQTYYTSLIYKVIVHLGQVKRQVDL